jgi:germination protein M
MRKNIFVLLFLIMLVFASCSQPSPNNSGKAADKDLKPQDARQASNSNVVDTTAKQGPNTASTDNKNSNGNTEKVSNYKVTDTQVTIYYSDNKGFIIPISRKVKWQEGIARAALYELVDNPSNRAKAEKLGLYPILPSEAKILGISIKDRTATIDFDRTLLDYSSAQEEKSIIEAIVYTITNFKTIDNVKILIEGRQQSKLKFGSEISGLLNRKNILINSDNLKLGSNKTKVDVYFYKDIESKAYILPVSFELDKFETKDLPRLIINAYAGEYPKDLSSMLPPNVKLLNSSIMDSTLILNFNSNFKNYGGTAREDAILNQILYSMKQVNDIEKVKILINGKAEELPEGTDISKGLEIPSEINLVAGNAM